MLLAIDTATRLMSLALHDGDNLIAEHSWQTLNHHTLELVPAIQFMLKNCAVAITDLTAIGVSIGPGSYTGLRVGVATAKGIAAANQLPAVGVSSLDILAAGQPDYQSGVGLIAIVEAGRGRVIVQSYHWRRGRWNSRTEPRILNWEELIESVDGSAFLTGEISEEGRKTVRAAQARGIPVKIAPPVYRLRRTGFLAELAWEQLSFEDVSTLFPIYLK